MTITKLIYSIIFYFKFTYKICVLLLLLSCISEKNYKLYETHDRKVWNGMLNYYNNEYEDSLEYLKEALTLINNDNPSIYFYAAAAALQLDDTIQAKNIIIESIVKTNTSKNYFLNFREFDQYRDKKLFTDIKDNYSAYVDEFFQTIENPEIYKKIDSLREKDQFARNNEISLKERSLIDSLNVVSLIEITKEYGWQKRGWLILWHQRDSYKEDNYVWEYFRPYIDSLIKKGALRKDFWAMFEENESILKSGKQIYGLYTSQFNQFPIKDIKNVDNRRKKIGLPPLWYLEKVYQIELPKDYQNSNYQF